MVVGAAVSESLKDLMKLCGMNGQKLAAEMAMEYGPVSTALQMDEQGIEPKRTSVRQRQAQIRAHLEMLVKVANRPSEEDNPRRRVELWDSIEVAAQRFPAPPGSTQAHRLQSNAAAFEFGQRVRMRLDPDSDLICRFLRVVFPAEPKAPYVDLVDTATGGVRSVTVAELRAGGRR